jgi:hypothetical protein
LTPSFTAWPPVSTASWPAGNSLLLGSVSPQSIGALGMDGFAASIAAFTRWAIGQKGFWMAAVLACGEGAVLSHRDAAALWELRSNARPAIDVTVVRTKRGSRRKVTIHSVRELHPNDLAEVDGIPVTSVARTLLDLAESLTLPSSAALTRRRNGVGSST